MKVIKTKKLSTAILAFCLEQQASIVLVNHEGTVSGVELKIAPASTLEANYAEAPHTLQTSTSMYSNKTFDELLSGSHREHHIIVTHSRDNKFVVNVVDYVEPEGVEYIDAPKPTPPATRSTESSEVLTEALNIVNDDSRFEVNIGTHTGSIKFTGANSNAEGFTIEFDRMSVPFPSNFVIKDSKLMSVTMGHYTIKAKTDSGLTVEQLVEAIRITLPF